MRKLMCGGVRDVGRKSWLATATAFAALRARRRGIVGRRIVASDADADAAMALDRRCAPMSRILFAWEMGGNLGHIAPDLLLAIAGHEAGYEVLFAAKDLAACSAAAREFGIDFVQAPVMRASPPRTGTPAAMNDAALLWQTGFSDASALEAVLLGWQGLFCMFKPDVMVYDFAPRALLAVSLADISRRVAEQRLRDATASLAAPRFPAMAAGARPGVARGRGARRRQNQ